MNWATIVVLVGWAIFQFSVVVGWEWGRVKRPEGLTIVVPIGKLTRFGVILMGSSLWVSLHYSWWETLEWYMTLSFLAAIFRKHVWSGFKIIDGGEDITFTI